MRFGRQAEHFNKKELRQAYDKQLHSGKPALPAERSQQLLQQLHQQILEAAASKSGIRASIVSIKQVWTAAAVVIVMAAGIWIFQQNEASHTVAINPPLPASQEVLESNTSDTVRRVLLSDASLVELSPGGMIRYYKSFDSGHRNISLSGQAIFTVKAQKQHPFTVYAGDISTTVLGTKFMMNYPRAGNVQVKLYEGKVKVSGSHTLLSMRDVYLKPGEQFMLDKKAGRYQVTAFNNTLTTASSATGNASGLEFTQVPLPQVLQQIEKRYHVQFRYDKETFNEIMVTGKFLPNDPLDVVLTLLGNSNNLSFKRQQDSIEVNRLP